MTAYTVHSDEYTTPKIVHTYYRHDFYISPQSPGSRGVLVFEYRSRALNSGAPKVTHYRRSVCRK